MDVTTWLVVILACFCVLQESFGSVQKSSKSPTIAKILQRLAKKSINVGDTSSRIASPQMFDLIRGGDDPTTPPAHASPTMYPYPTINQQVTKDVDFFQNWYSCSVLDTVLGQYFKNFPNTEFPKDSMNISHGEIRRVLTRAVSAYDYLKNVRMAVDLSMEDMSKLILDQRVNCTATMYQRIFVYYMRQRLDQMMSPRDTSLKSRIEVILNLYFPNNPAILSRAGDLVRGIHLVVYESFIQSLQEEEFKSLERFLGEYKGYVAVALMRFNRGDFATINDLKSEMVKTFFRFLALYPDALRCTTPQEFILLHKRVVNQTTNYYWQAHKSGQAVFYLTNRILQFFDQPHASSPVNVDPLVMSNAIQKMVTVILGYVNDTMVELATYEGYLAPTTLSPPTFMARSLSDVQWNRTMVLFFRMFFNSTPPPTATVSPGSSMTPEKMAIYLQKDVDNLIKIQALMPNAWTSDPEHATIQNELSDMIKEKTKLIDAFRSQPVILGL